VSPRFAVHQKECPMSSITIGNLAQSTSVLNNSVIGAGASLPGLNISPSQWAMNGLNLPGFSVQHA
jgi:hypothetical protein